MNITPFRLFSQAIYDIFDRTSQIQVILRKYTVIIKIQRIAWNMVWDGMNFSGRGPIFCYTF